jgi:hypothetical protein
MRRGGKRSNNGRFEPFAIPRKPSPAEFHGQSRSPTWLTRRKRLGYRVHAPCARGTGSRAGTRARTDAPIPGGRTRLRCPATTDSARPVHVSGPRGATRLALHRRHDVDRRHGRRTGIRRRPGYPSPGCLRRLRCEMLAAFAAFAAFAGWGVDLPGHIRRHFGGGSGRPPGDSDPSPGHGKFRIAGIGAPRSRTRHPLASPGFAQVFLLCALPYSAGACAGVR